MYETQKNDLQQFVKLSIYVSGIDFKLIYCLKYKGRLAAPHKHLDNQFLFYFD